jgi:hypothetical protein
VVIVGGRSGTLSGGSPSPENGKLIRVLEGTGGIAAAIPALEAALTKATGAEVLYDTSPGRLIDRLVARFTSPDYVCPCSPASLQTPG